MAQLRPGRHVPDLYSAAAVVEQDQQPAVAGGKSQRRQVWQPSVPGYRSLIPVAVSDPARQAS